MVPALAHASSGAAPAASSMAGIDQDPAELRCPGAMPWRGFNSAPPAGPLGAGAGPSGRIGSIGVSGTAGAMGTTGAFGTAGAPGAAGIGGVDPDAGGKGAGGTGACGAVLDAPAPGGAATGAFGACPADAADAPEDAGAPAAAGWVTVLVNAFGGNPRGGGAGGVRRSATCIAPPVGTSTLPASLLTATRPWITRSSSPGR